MSENDTTRCALCGGPVDENGRAVAPLASLPPTGNIVPPRLPPPPGLAKVRSVAQLCEEDPLAHLTPGERFARAVDRRDALVRDRRVNTVDRRNPLTRDRRTN